MLRRALSACALTAALPAAALIPGTTATAFAADTPLPAIERYAPSALPDRVVLIPTDDPAHSQRVNWRSTAETPEAQIIEEVRRDESASTFSTRRVGVHVASWSLQVFLGGRQP
ncbi:MAG TPA: hypothetical protein VLK58_14530 [Conexibacter sp.]|nr:hypothetical protein [Conexibacter sp.]